MGTIFVGAIVICVIGLAAHKVYQDHKSGKGCGGGCESCSACPGRRNADGVKPE